MYFQREKKTGFVKDNVPYDINSEFNGLQRQRET